jgi:hypothetical protein
MGVPQSYPLYKYAVQRGFVIRSIWERFLFVCKPLSIVIYLLNPGSQCTLF